MEAPQTFAIDFDGVIVEKQIRKEERTVREPIPEEQLS